MTSLRRDVNLVSIHEVVQTRPAFFRVCFSMLTVFVFLPAVILIPGSTRSDTDRRHVVSFWSIRRVIMNTMMDHKKVVNSQKSKLSETEDQNPAFPEGDDEKQFLKNLWQATTDAKSRRRWSLTSFMRSTLRTDEP